VQRENLRQAAALGLLNNSCNMRMMPGIGAHGEPGQCALLVTLQ